MIRDRAPELYRSGTMGPVDSLLGQDGHAWIDPYED